MALAAKPATNPPAGFVAGLEDPTNAAEATSLAARQGSASAGQSAKVGIAYLWSNRKRMWSGIREITETMLRGGCKACVQAAAD